MDIFLRQYAIKDKVGITHTRIGDINKGVLPGKYSIPETKMDEFYQLYYDKVFVKKEVEYLTEVQWKKGGEEDKNKKSGPILIDLDFRYAEEISKRQHTNEHVFDIVTMYMDEIKNMCMIKDGEQIDVYVLHKDHINKCGSKGIVKDGIHIVITLGMDHIFQQLLRKRILEKIDSVLSVLDVKNSYENVIDDGIPKGHTNWQLFGSRKPGHEQYKLTHHYIFTYEENEDGYDIDEDGDINPSLEILKHICARNNSHKHLSLRNYIKEEYENMNKQRTKKYNIRLQQRTGENNNISSIRSKDDLETQFNIWYETLDECDYAIKETYKYTMILPESYYNDRNKWIRVGWALHHCSPELFLGWMMFSVQWNEFNYLDIPELHEQWRSFQQNGITERSIMYWARQENEEGYKKIRSDTIDYMMEQSVNSCTEWDVANVLYHYYKDTFRCGSLKRKEWYMFRKHRWEENEGGNSIRYKMSNTLSRLYTKKSGEYGKMSIDQELSAEESDRLKTIGRNLSTIAVNLRHTQYKQNVMREAMEIFYENDSQFMQKLNLNPYLVAFTNGVYDFSMNPPVFRPGRPDDYISMSTNIKYVPFSKRHGDKREEQQQIKREIEEFMAQLFPKPELRKYMWDHLASVLIGENKPQTFNIYNGCGRNGKSGLVDLMRMCLGDYFGVVPTSLVTEKRGGVGSLTPEIAQLQGKRYAVMQEPSRGDSLNDGVMKMLTGQDPIQANPKYKDPITFIPQFKLVVCTNNLFDIKSQDDGTWRRIRLCEFISKFVVDPHENPDHHEFMIDYEIEHKFKRWRELFMSMLVDITIKNQGNVKDCKLVLSASNAYRQDQDSILTWAKERIAKRTEILDDMKAKKYKLTITEVWQDYLCWVRENTGSKTNTKRKELQSFMLKYFGKDWSREYIIQIDDDDDENMMII